MVGRRVYAFMWIAFLECEMGNVHPLHICCEVD